MTIFLLFVSTLFLRDINIVSIIEISSTIEFVWLRSVKLFFNFICPGLNNEEYQVVIGNDTTRYIIDDLEPARNYTFYVVAYMPMGASRMSDNVFQHTLEDGEAYAH